MIGWRSVICIEFTRRIGDTGSTEARYYVPCKPARSSAERARRTCSPACAGPPALATEHPDKPGDLEYSMSRAILRSTDPAAPAPHPIADAPRLMVRWPNPWHLGTGPD